MGAGADAAPTTCSTMHQANKSVWRGALGVLLTLLYSARMQLVWLCMSPATPQPTKLVSIDLGILGSTVTTDAN